MVLIAAWSSTAVGQTRVPFERLDWGGLMLVPEGHYVIEDSLTWEQEFVPYWPEMWQEVDGDVYLVPPPRPDFDRNLIVYVSHGMTGCYECGGNVDSITVAGPQAIVHLGHVYNPTPVCLADTPRGDVLRIARTDLPEDVAFEFRSPSGGYPIDPHQWYPLALGNAWSYAYDNARVERVVEREVEDNLEWFRILSYDCSEATCEPDSTFWLAWTGDAFLLNANDARTRVDTVLNPVDRSPFSVNQAVDTLLLRTKSDLQERLAVAFIYLRRDPPFDEMLWLDLVTAETGERIGSFVSGYGPEDASGAIIDGIPIGDTSLLDLVLSSDDPRPSRADLSLSIFPHPAPGNATISIEGAAPGGARLEMFDLLGRRLAVRTVRSDAYGTWTISLRELTLPPSGLYLLKVIDASGRATTRSFVVTR